MSVIGEMSVNKTPVSVISDGSAAADEFLRRTAVERSTAGKHRSFHVGDLGDIVRKMDTWTRLLPRVQPFYAVKANDEPVVLAVMARLGAGFDCASKGEIGKVLQLPGVTPLRIIYANTCKQTSHIRYAAERGVQLTTFDSEEELRKVKQEHPRAKLLLRIVPANYDRYNITPEMPGVKYGSWPYNVPRLLRLAKQLDLDVVGVSFHVGPLDEDPSSFADGVQRARNVFDAATLEGFRLSIVDIGGGFFGSHRPPVPFEEQILPVRDALDRLFPEESGVRIIAEPGKYFVHSSFTLCANIILTREVRDGGDVEGENADEAPTTTVYYYLNDGIYGSFSTSMTARLAPTAKPLSVHRSTAGEPTYRSAVWGPTCDWLDCILPAVDLPRLSTGDWLLFDDSGAYATSVATDFNSMPRPKRFYVVQQSYRHRLADDE